MSVFLSLRFWEVTTKIRLKPLLFTFASVLCGLSLLIIFYLTIVGLKPNDVLASTANASNQGGITVYTEDRFSDLVVTTTHYIDSLRTNLATPAYTGTRSISVTNSAGFTRGQEILIIVMQGSNTGLYETQWIKAVSGHRIILSNTLQNEFDTFSNTIMIQHIPHYREVTIEDGGVLTAHPWDGQSGGVVSFRAENVRVAQSGAIDASGLGYRGGGPSDQGKWDSDGYQGESTRKLGVSGGYPGDDPNGVANDGGGGVYFNGGGGNYGGGASNSEESVVDSGRLLNAKGLAGIEYGSFSMSKIYLGSGGGGAQDFRKNNLPTGGSGGGIIYVDANDHILIEGMVINDGLNGSFHTTSGWGSGGGSGGSIKLLASRISIFGLVKANGGLPGCTPDYCGGSGGLGRIRLDAMIITGTTNPTPYISMYNMAEIAGYSTISVGRDVVVGDNVSTLTVTVQANDANGSINGLPVSLTISNPDIQIYPDQLLTNSEGKAHFKLTSLVTTALPITAAAQATILTAVPITLSHSPVVTFTPSTIIISEDTVWNFPAIGASKLIITDNANLILSHPLVELNIDTLVITDGATLNLRGVNTIYAKEVAVGVNASILAVGDVPPVRSNNDLQPLQNGAGGSHGGYGGDTLCCYSEVVYGDVYFPVQTGTAGGTGYTNLAYGGYGGGAIHFVVEDTFDVQGQVSVAGTNGQTDKDTSGGGGSGGSLLIEIPRGEFTLSSTAQLIAHGGNSTLGGGGGGGRIAIYAQTKKLNGQIDVNGGSGAQGGEIGTIYLDEVDPYQSFAQLNTPTAYTGTAGATITVTAEAQGGQPLSNQPVGIYLLEGDQALLVGTESVSQTLTFIGMTNGQGLFTETLTSEITGSYEIGLFVGYVPLKTEKPLTLTFQQAGVDTGTSTVQVDPKTVPAWDGFSTQVTIFLAQEDGTPIQNKDVHLLTNGVEIEINPPVPVTNWQGEAIAYISTPEIQNVVITPTVDGVSLMQTAAITFTAGPIDLLQSTISISPSVAIASDNDAIAVSATLRDERTRPLINRTFTLYNGSSVSTDQEGQISFSLTSAEVGTQTIILEEAYTQSTAEIGTVEFTAADPDPSNSFIAVSQITIPADGQTDALITATVQDSFGHPVANEPVTISFSATFPITISQIATQTNSTGQVTATITSTAVQPATITATIDDALDALIENTQTVVFQPTAIDPAQIAFNVTPTAAVANGRQPITITAHLTDTFGRPFANMPLALEVGEQSTLIFPSDTQTTTASGHITFTLVSTTAGTEPITLTDTTYQTSLALGTVEFLPSTVDATQSSIELMSPYETSYADGEQTLEVIVTARDGNGNVIPDAAVIPDITTGLNPNPIILSQSRATTDENGQLSLTLQSPVPVNGRIWIIIDGVFISQYLDVRFANADPDQSLLEIVGLDVATADGQELIQLSAIANSSDSTPLSGGSVTFSTTAEYADSLSFIQPNQLTAANGRTIGFVASQFDGIYPVYATIDGIQLSDPVTVTFKGPDLALNVDAPPELMAGFPITYDLTVHNDSGFDAYNIVITETLPAGAIFLSASPQLTYDSDTHQLHGTFSYLTAGASTHLTAVLQIPTTTIASLDFTAVATMDQSEANLVNNQASFTTQTTPPAAVLTIETPYPVTTVPQGAQDTLEILVRNTGSLPIENLRTTIANELPWLTLPEQIEVIPPFTRSISIPITVAPEINTSPATYLNTVTFTADNTLPQDVSINTSVQSPTRDVIIIASDQDGELIPDVFISIKETQTVYAQPDILERTINHHNFTSQTGRAFFNDLSSDKTYTLTASAVGYEHLEPIIINVPRETDPYQFFITLQAVSELLIEPAVVNMVVRQNDVDSELVTIRNVGTRDITDIIITPPENEIDFAYLGLSNPPSILEPDEAFTFSLNVAPSISVTDGIYQDVLSVVAANGVSQTVPVIVRARDGALVTLCVIAIAEYNQMPLADITVVATEQTGRSPDDFQQTLTEQTDDFGQACFSDLPIGPYLVELIWNGEKVAAETIDLVYDETRPAQVQYEEIYAQTPSVDVSWSVTPIKLTDQYTTTMTLEFWPESPPILAASPQSVRICAQDNGIITETVTIHNFFPVYFTNVRVGLGIMNEDDSIRATLTDPETGLSVTEGEILDINPIAPDADKELLLTAELKDREACSGSSGTVFLRVFADYQQFLDNPWYTVDETVDRVPLNERGQIPLKLAYRDYPEESNVNKPAAPLENVTISQPQIFDWMTVTPTYFETIAPGEFELFTLDVEAPAWLPAGIYRDHLLVTSTNGIPTVIGIEAERTPFGLEIETRFVTPLTAIEEAEPKDEDLIKTLERHGSTMIIEGTTSLINNTFSLRVGCDDCSDPPPAVKRNGSSLTYTTVGHLPVGTPTPTSGDFENRVVIFQLSQQFAIEREAFLAQLDLRNGLPVPLTDMSVEIQITDRPDELGEKITIRNTHQTITRTQPFTPNMPSITAPLSYPIDDDDLFFGAPPGGGSGGSGSGSDGGNGGSGGSDSRIPYHLVASNIPDSWQQSSFVNFIMVPDTPTSLPDIQAGDSYLATWTLVPDAIGLTDLNGVDFYVQATINYTPDGQSPAPPITTNPARIRVQPQPLLVLDYFLPTYVSKGTPFYWTAIVSNVGSGIARNVRIHTPQPVILSTKGDPVSFTIINETEYEFREIWPGESKEMVFEIVPSEEGAFAGASATCEQQNYKGVMLPPLIYCDPTIHWLDTSFLYYAQQQTLAKEGCMTTQHQAFQGDPVNTYSGNFTLPEPDLSIPTWGFPLEFERTYNALSQDEPGPFGHGWTHNYNSSIEYRPYIYRNESGETVTENRLSARLPHGSRVYFEVDIDGNIEPMPGVRAQLTESLGVYTLTQECDDTIYIFENRLFTDPFARLDAILTKIIDGDGNITSFDYDPDDGYLTKVTDPSGRTLTFTYRYEDKNDHWYLETVTDPLGRIWAYQYTDGYLTAVVEPDGRTTHYTYTIPSREQYGYLQTITDPDGYQILYNEYDPLGRIAWQEDALGARTTFIYTQDPATGKKYTRLIDPLGRATLETYNDKGALESRQDPFGYIETFTYDENYNLIAQTDKLGAETSYAWTPCHCDMTTITDTLGYTINMSYDDNKRPIAFTNKLGHTTRLEYDTSTKPTAVINPLGIETTYTYRRGQLSTATDALGHTTDYDHDLHGNVTAVTDAMGNISTMTYDAAGRLTTTTDPRGYTTTLTYDLNDNLIAITTITATTVMTYDGRDNLVALRDPLGRLTTYQYNSRSELIAVTNSLDGVQQMSYDLAGNLIAETNPLSQTTYYIYDNLNQLIAVTDALSQTTTFTYDPLGRVTTETNAKGATTQYQYDATGVTTIFADGSQLQANYDPQGKVTQITDAAGRTIQYDYDPLGRLTTETNPLGQQTQYGYDVNNNLTSQTNQADQTTFYQYDPLNRLISTTNPISGVTVMTYDPSGNQIGITDPLGRSWEYAYNGYNRLTAATNPLDEVTRYSYDPLGNIITMIDPLGRVTRTTYDALNRPITITNPAGFDVTYTYDAASNITALTDTEGRTTTYRYDPLGRPIAVINPLNETTTLAYDTVGNQIAQTDPLGRVTLYTYDQLNQQTATIDPIGNLTTYDYDAVGNLIQYTDALGRATTYTYNPLDQITTIANPLGDTMSFTYDILNRPTIQTDFTGNKTFYDYDPLGRTTAITNALGYATTLSYDAVGNLLTATDPNGATLIYQYDALDRPIQITDPISGTTSYTYDAAGNQTTIVGAGFKPAPTIGNPLTTTTQFTYDTLNRLTAVTDPLGHTTTFTYSPAGNILTSTNPLNHTTTYAYDDLNRLTHSTDPLGHTTSYTYDRAGNQKTVTDPLGRTVRFTYDPLNRPTQIEAPLGRLIRYAYDAVGNQTAEIHGLDNPQLTTFNYDDLNRLTTVADPLGNQTTYTYDPMGNPLTVTDPLGRAITYTYDDLYRPIAITDPLNQSTRYTYDAAGNQTALTNAVGHTTQFTYDQLGRPLQLTDPLSGTMAFTYDPLGNLHTTTDAAGRTVTYDYDLLGRLTTSTDPLGHATTYTYDPIGNLISSTDPLNRTTRYEYDPANRLVTVGAGFKPAPTTETPSYVQFNYDAVGNLTTQTDPLGRVTTYTLDDLNQVTTVTDPLNHQIHYTYDEIGNLTQITDANGRTATLTYDPLNRLTAATNALGHSTRYQYDAAGQNTTIIDPLGFVTAFTYDPIGRLLTITDPLSRTASYQYDRLGNPLETIDANGIRTRYSYDPLNRLTAVTENYAPTQPTNQETNVTHNFTYDRVGNLTAMTNPLGNTFTFAYDELNRMTTTADPLGHAYTYTYDPVSNLTQMLDANGQTTTFTYDHLDRVTQITRPDETIAYTYDAAGNRLTMSDPTGQTTYAFDDLNRLTQVTDPRDQIVSYDYDPVGNRTGLTYPAGQTVTYTYDAIDRLTQVTDWDGGQTAYTYDNSNRLTQVAYPNSVIGTFNYDAAHQLTDITYNHFTRTLSTYTYTHDAIGNRTQTIERVASPSELPIANFTAAPRTGTAPLVVTFTNETINAQSLRWNFGDGSAVVDDNSDTLTHTYSEPGTYTVTLTAFQDEFTHILTRTAYITVLPDDTPIAEDGLLIIEAENYTQNTLPAEHFWTTATTLPGYSGENYLQVTPDNGTLFEFTPVTPTQPTGERIYLPLIQTAQTAAFDTSTTQPTHIHDAPVLTYDVYFNEVGRYQLWVRGAAVDSASGSVHIGLSKDQHVTLSGFPINQWAWSNDALNGQPAVLEIPASGNYTIHVWAREDGFQLDRLILSTDPIFIPQGIGPKPSTSAKTYTGTYAEAPYATSQQYAYYDAELTEALTIFSVWNTILANLGMLFIAPLALILPWAYRTRHKKLAQYLVALGLGLAFITSGLGLFFGATPVEALETQANRSITLPQAMLPATNDGLPLQIINYDYDPLYRLTAASYSDGTQLGYSYDAAGNRLTASQNGAIIDTFTYDAANRLTGRNGTPFTYDNNGNLLSDGEYNYTYDSANRLKTMQDAAAVSLTSYAYNGDGVRTLLNTDGIDTHFVQDVAAMLPRVLSAESGGTHTLSLWGVGLIGEQRGGTGSHASAAQWQYDLPDALGSIRQVTDANGGLALTRSYDPFGNVLTADGDGRSQYGFTGEEQAESGHLHLRARMYNPAYGRFLQQDTVFGNPADPKTLHRYAYGFNNPVNYTDPSGRMPAQSGHALPLQNAAARSATMASQTQLTASDTTGSRGTLGTYTPGMGGPTAQGSGCFVDGLLGLIQGMFAELFDFATNLALMMESFLNVIIDPANAAQHWEKGWNHANKAWETVVEHGTDILIFVIEATVLGTPLDFIAAVTGYNILTGEKLSWQERVFAAAMVVIDLATGGFGDDLIEAGITIAKMAGAVQGTVKITAGLTKGIAKGVGNIAAGSVKGLLKMGAGAGQIALKGIDDVVQKISRSANDVLDAGRRQVDAVDNVGRGVAKASDNATTTLRHGDEASTAAKRVDTNGRTVDEYQDKDACRVDNSFTAGTSIDTEDGSVPIEDIEAGDRVLGEDPSTGERGYFEVVSVRNYPTTKLVRVTIQIGDDNNGGDNDGAPPAEEANSDDDDEDDHPSSTEVMNVTHEHPIYVEGNGWVHANNLEIGDRLRLADGGMAKVLAIDQDELDQPETVYNFTVRGPHTYFVLDAQLLVHNCLDPVQEVADLRRTVSEGLSLSDLKDIAFAMYKDIENFTGRTDELVQNLLIKAKQSGKSQMLYDQLQLIKGPNWDFSPEGLAKIQQQMVEHLGSTDIKNLAFDLHIDVDNLGNMKSDIVLALIRKVKQEGIEKDFYKWMSKTNPVDWDFTEGGVNNLYEQMMQNLSLDDMKNVAFSLHIDFENLNGQKNKLIIDLIKEAKSSGQMNLLRRNLHSHGIQWTKSKSLKQLQQGMSNTLQVSDIHNLAFDMGIRNKEMWASPLETKVDYARSLLLRAEKDGRLQDFITHAKKLNPNRFNEFGD